LITRERDQLFQQRSGQERTPIVPQTDREFFLKTAEDQILFDVDEKGQTAG